MYQNESKSPLVSVIVPVYKAEKTLGKCLDSILAQSYAHFEVVVVDDGSPDSSGLICDKYAERDSRIRVVHQANGGVSKARQTGMENAQGEYTIHVDPDDWVEPDMLEELVRAAVADNADMVMCDYMEDDGDRHRLVRQAPAPDGQPIDSKDVLKKMLFQQLHGSCCNKLVRRVCYNNVFFTPSHLNILEDLLSNARILARGIRISYVPKAFYHYWVGNSNSICHNVTDLRIRSRIDVIKAMREELNIEDEHLYILKKSVLYDLLEVGRLDEVMSMYPESHRRVLSEGYAPNIFAPYKNSLYVAIKGYPRLAHIMLSLNLSCINLYKRITR